MFKLIKVLVSLICLAAFVWWGMTVQLGDHTLFGHIAAIGSSKESKDLVRGTKEKVADLKKRMVEDKPASEKLNVIDQARLAAKSQERLINADRRDIKRLLDKRGKAAAGTAN